MELIPLHITLSFLMYDYHIVIFSYIIVIVIDYPSRVRDSSCINIIVHLILSFLVFVVCAHPNLLIRLCLYFLRAYSLQC